MLEVLTQGGAVGWRPVAAGASAACTGRSPRSQRRTRTSVTRSQGCRNSCPRRIRPCSCRVQVGEARCRRRRADGSPPARGASAAAVAKAAVATVLARAARACRPRCCQEWAASLEAMEAVEPQAAATIARRCAIRSWRNRRRSTSPSRCPCRGVKRLSATVDACRSRRSWCRTGHPGTRRPGRRRRSSHPRHQLAFRCE